MDCDKSKVQKASVPAAISNSTCSCHKISMPKSTSTHGSLTSNVQFLTLPCCYIEVRIYSWFELTGEENYVSEDLPGRQKKININKGIPNEVSKSDKNYDEIINLGTFISTLNW